MASIIVDVSCEELVPAISASTKSDTNPVQ